MIQSDTLRYEYARVLHLQRLQFAAIDRGTRVYNYVIRLGWLLAIGTGALLACRLHDLPNLPFLEFALMCASPLLALAALLRFAGRPIEALCMRSAKHATLCYTNAVARFYDMRAIFAREHGYYDE